MRTKKMAALLTALMMAVAASGCSDPELEEDAPQPAEESTSAPAETTVTSPEKTGDAEVIPTSSDTGSLIMRKKRSTETPMGEEGTWTIFVYLCGADLESQNGAGTSDIVEMFNSSANENVRFIIQTGGATEWQCDVSPEVMERYYVHDGKCELVFTGDDVDMGDSATLADFLNWGISEYPAANMGLVFWDHGSGSINGVCYDEKHDNHSLGLKDIDAALYSVYDQMTEPFEFIGFDACLMGTAETAAIMATHARYLVASQETEPGSGWNYTKIGDYMAENPSCTGAELGKIIVDSFYDDCDQAGQGSGVTLSVTDLSKMDKFIEAFNDYSKDIYELTENGGNFTAVARNINDAENFGGNDKSSGYTNMVDLGGIINAGKESSSHADAAISALSDAVVYMKNGSDHTDATGLSVYYPLQVGGSSELGLFKDVALSSYYLGLVDKVAYGSVNGGISDYDNSGKVEEFSNDWSSDQYSASGDFLSYEAQISDEWAYADEYQAGSGKAEIKFDVEPGFDEDGFYSFTLSQDSVDSVDHIEGGVYVYDEENQFSIELGYSGDVFGDFESGCFTDGFNRHWFALPDGQYLPAYLQDNCDGYDIYSSPILLNGEQTNLRFAYFYNDDDEDDYGYCEIIDVWDGVGENGCVGRSGGELKKGDVIVPYYYLIILDPESEVDETYFEGNKYKYTDDTEITLKELEDSDYLYCFFIYDIFGNYELTDFVKFTVKGKDVDYDMF